MDELTGTEREQLDRLYSSLYAPEGLAAVRETPNALIRFEALANWIDKVSRLSTGRKTRGEPAWRHFARKYLARQVSDREVHLLYDGVRCKLSHEWGTKDVLLTHEDPDAHWTYEHGLLVLNLETLMEEYDAAFMAFYEALRSDATLRHLVLPHVDALVAPVVIRANTEAALSASASSSETRTLLGLIPRDFRALASATAGPEIPMVRDDEARPKKAPPE